MERKIKKISFSILACKILFLSAEAEVPCQNGISYKNRCDPYINVNLIKAKVPENRSYIKENRVAVKSIEKKPQEEAVYHEASFNEELSYLDSLRERYSQQYSGDTGLQALIDRSSYFKKVKNILNKKETNAKQEEKANGLEAGKYISKAKEKRQKFSKIVSYTVKKGDSLIKIAKQMAVDKMKIIKLNGLEKNGSIKVGQILKIPLKNSIQENIKTTLNKGFYIVKKGDSLIKIAKKLNVSIVKLRELNRLSRSSHIKVGQKLVLKPSLFKSKFKRYDIVKNIKFRKVPSLKFKRKIRVIATAYTSHRNQTDKTPFLAAWNNRLKPGMKIIAVSPDLIKKYGLTNGVKVKILGLPGYYVVRDKMNKRLRNHIDIYMGTNKRKALKWGRRRIVLYW